MPDLPLILVVEDDGLIRLDLVDQLVDCGFSRVLEAANADQARRVIEANPEITLLLTDIDMPGTMNGVALAFWTAAKLPNCRIVIVSGRFHPDADKLPLGARFLSKPFSERKFGQILEELGFS